MSNIKFSSTLFFAFLVTAITPHCYAAIAYVAPNGDNSLSVSTEETPFRTITRAINAVGVGDHTIYVRAGEYRERIEINTGGTANGRLKIFAYPGETPIIKGSDLVDSGWEQVCNPSYPQTCNENVWRVTWPPNPLPPTQVDNHDYQPPQQVFLNGVTPLTQIGQRAAHHAGRYIQDGYSLSDLRESSYYYDESTQHLYIWLPPGNDPFVDDIEISARLRTLFNHQDYLHVRGLSFMHANSSYTMEFGDSVDIGDHSIIEYCNIQWNDFGGLKVRENNIVQYCNISNNGAVGININGHASTTGYNFEISNNQITGNNYRFFNSSWHAGGIKATTNANGTITNNIVENNLGTGIWYDGCKNNSPFYVSSNYVNNNRIMYNGSPQGEGIHIEISDNGQVINNVVTNHNRRAIYISASNNTLVANNTIAHNNGINETASIEMNGLPRSNSAGIPYTLRGNSIINNIIYDTGIGVHANRFAPDLKLRKNNTCVVTTTPCAGPDYPPYGQNDWIVSGNTSNHNLIYRPNDPYRQFILILIGNSLRYSSNSGENSIQDWITETGGWDSNSRFVDPDLTVMSGDQFIPSSFSEAVDTGSALIQVTHDKAGFQRPQGATHDIGAYEIPDVDGDGFLAPADCDDLNSTTHPGALETVNDGIDQDCMGGDATIVVHEAHHKASTDTFSVEASYTGGGKYDAPLHVEGYPTMFWNNESNAWRMEAWNIETPPVSIRITGPEGTIEHTDISSQ